MFPDKPYAPARGSFQTPVPVPPFDPDAAPTQSVAINCSWMPYIRGALMQLLLQATWDTDDPAVRLLAQQRAWTLIAMFTECSEVLLPFDCSGDFHLTPSPFNTFSIEPSCPLGVWFPAIGYAESGDNCGGVGYNGIELHLTLDDPVEVGNVSFNYDLLLGQVTSPGDYQAGVYDFDNHAFIGTPVLFSGAVSANNQTYNSGPGSAPTANLLLFVRCGENVSGALPSPGGTCNMYSASVSGLAGRSPC